jgi:hypothetical protein
MLDNSLTKVFLKPSKSCPVKRSPPLREVQDFDVSKYEEGVS